MSGHHHQSSNIGRGRSYPARLRLVEYTGVFICVNLFSILVRSHMLTIIISHHIQGGEEAVPL